MLWRLYLNTPRMVALRSTAKSRTNAAGSALVARPISRDECQPLRFLNVTAIPARKAPGIEGLCDVPFWIDCSKPSIFYLPREFLWREQFRTAQELLRTSEDRRIKEIQKFASDSAGANSDAHRPSSYRVRFKARYIFGGIYRALIRLDVLQWSESLDNVS